MEVITQHGLHYFTVEQMPNNYRVLAKQRESVEATYRFQIGLFAEHATQRAQLQERLQQTFIFDRFPYLNTESHPATECGSFLCDLTGVVPMFAEAVNNQSDYHRVYFDVEITDIKRRR